MRKLLFSISMSMIILFIYWVSIYYASGYNLTDNVAHLDMASMVKQFTNNLNNNNNFIYGANGLNALTKFNNYFDNLFNKLTSIITNPFIISNNDIGFNIILGGIRLLVKGLNIILQPVNLLSNIINNLIFALTNTIYFFHCFIKFLIYPIFV